MMGMRLSHNLLMGVAIASVVAGSVLPALPGPSSAGERGETESGTIVVPFKMLPSNHMVVEARLNGKGPYRFIFDLGAPVTLLNNQAAESSGAIDKKAPKSFLMGTRGEGKIKTLEMGDLNASDVPVIVMDHPALRALGSLFSRPLSGIIGYTFWARYKMTIDYQAKEMTFTPVDFEVKDLMKELPSRMSGRKAAREIVHAPRGLWGLRLAEPDAKAVSVSGVRVTAVLEGSPAALAGVEPGDLLTGLDGRWTTSVADALAAAEGVPAGQAAEMTVERDGQERTLTVTPSEGL